MIGYKYCRGCRDTKPLDAFGLDRRSADGFRTRCKACRNRGEYVHYMLTPDARHARAERTRRSRAKYDQLHQQRLNGR